MREREREKRESNGLKKRKKERECGNDQREGICVHIKMNERQCDNEREREKKVGDLSNQNDEVNCIVK